jgi:predicted ATP-grasp superfamily ATP-dependent carboligase
MMSHLNKFQEEVRSWVIRFSGEELYRTKGMTNAKALRHSGLNTDGT